jgi:hypothetical protein
MTLKYVPDRQLSSLRKNELITIIQELREDIERLEADNVRLRAALQEIADAIPATIQDGTAYSAAKRDGVRMCARRAAAALEAKPSPDTATLPMTECEVCDGTGIVPGYTHADGPEYHQTAYYRESAVKPLALAMGI